MVVNDNAGNPDERGVRESIAGKPAPTGIASSVFPGIAMRLSAMPDSLFLADCTPRITRTSRKSLFTFELDL
jgi:hypothetical protein